MSRTIRQKLADLAKTKLYRELVEARENTKKNPCMGNLNAEKDLFWEFNRLFFNSIDECIKGIWLDQGKEEFRKMMHLAEINLLLFTKLFTYYRGSIDKFWGELDLKVL